MASILDVLVNSNPVSAAVGGVVQVIGKVLDKVIPDPAAKAAAALELVKLQQNGELAQMAAEVQLAQGQLEINKIEAATDGVFKGGWRPFIGWVCGVGLATQFVVAPLATWIATLVGHSIAFPALDLGTLMTLLFGMLGLGGLRTYEKIKA
jgi:hypothetical protein